MTLASPPQSGPRPGSIALILAWLILLGVLAAAAGYVFLAPEEQAVVQREEAAPGVIAARDQAPEAAPPVARPGAEDAGESEIPKIAAPTTEPAEAAPALAAAPEPAKPEAPEPEVVEPEVVEPEAPEPEVDEPKVAEPEVAEPAPAPEPQEAPRVAEAAPAPPEPKVAPEPEVAAAPAPPEPMVAPEPETATPPAPDSTPPKEAKAPESTEPGGEQLAALPRPAPPDPNSPWRRNRQPFDEADERPRIAVVLTGLGLATTMTEAAIKQLPPGVTLSFTPYSRKLNQWIALARVNGHEVLLDLPMEPTSYPDDDPGPHAMLTALSSAQNLDRLRWTLGRATGYVGVAATMGSRFAASEAHMSPILKELKDRGLLFLDNRASENSVAGRLASEIGVPRAVNDRPLDWVQASRVAIDARLVQLENMARAQGTAVAMGRPYPVTIERLGVWARGLKERGLVLAPISAVANRQPLRRTARRETQTQ